MRMWAGDCALGSLIASPFFLPVLFWPYARPLPLLSKEATKKAWSHACYHEHGPTTPSIDHSEVHSQVQARVGAGPCFSTTRLVFPVDFVNFFFNIVFETSWPVYCVLG